MKNLYKKIIRFLFKTVLGIERLKTFFAEWIAIYRKAPLYRNIKWTKEQKREFDEFWKSNYGRRISPRWHKLYQASNGVYRIDYMPEIIYSTKIEPKINDYTYSAVFSDKSFNEVLFNKRAEGVRTPKCYIFNSYGRFYDSQRNLISKSSAAEIIENIGEAVIKPTVDSSSGKDVIIVNMQEGKNLRDGTTSEQILEKYKENFIVQEKVVASKELSDLYSKSINTLRVISYIVGDKIHVAPVSLRMGGGGGEVDNIHAGGMSIAVTNDGYLAKRAYRLGYGDSFEFFEAHPDTGVVFEGYRLSFVDKVINAAEKLHEMTSNVGIISWDFTVDKNGYIVVIEANLKGQSVWFPQMLSGEAMFGENTKEVLKTLRRA